MSEYTISHTTDHDAAESMLPCTENGVKIKGIARCKSYKRRWIVLSIFVVFACVSLMQWIQYSIIANVIVTYYNVSYAAADWSSMIYLVVYIILCIPGFYVLDKWDLRISILGGAIGTCAGAWVKLASIAPDRYWVLLLGQGIVAAGQVLILPVPPKIAAIWFGPKEISTACSIAVFGCQMGIAIGFLIPPMIVKTIQKPESIETELYQMALGTAVASSFVLLLVIAFFKPEPPIPPSIAQFRLREDKKNKPFNYFHSVKSLFCNRSYVLLLLSYSINVGVYYAISTLLNQIILKYYPDAAQDAGRMGFFMTAITLIGTIACGAILDKFNRFKETFVATYLIALLGMIAFTFTLNKGIVLCYLITATLGFSLAGVLMIGLQLAAELTYPEPEGTAAGVLSALAQVFGIIFTYLYSFLFNSVSDVSANLSMCMFLFLGLLLIFCMRFDLRRQSAQMPTE